MKTRNENEIQVISFRVGSLLIGLELTDVQEINRHCDFARVPNSPKGVRGVINLRGEVVTMIDLAMLLNQQTDSCVNTKLHNVFVKYESELIGLITNGVSDSMTIHRDSIDALPSNLDIDEANFFTGVHRLPDGKLMVLLDLNQLLTNVLEIGSVA
ncbi:MAG: chemotaxis protein CheW [Pirellulaceae bacterium]